MIFIKTLKFTIKDMWTRNRYAAERLEVIKHAEVKLQQKFDEIDAVFLKTTRETEKLTMHDSSKLKMVNELFELKQKNAHLESNADVAVFVHEMLEKKGHFEWYGRPVGYLDVQHNIGIC